MDRFTRLFAALEQIFGKGFVSRLMGKQSNVITLPSKDAQRFLNKELNIAEASEAAVKKGIEDLEKLVSDTKKISLINDQELLTLTNNAERVAARSPKIPLPPVTKKPADVVDITTKEKISPEGVMSLTEKVGQVARPGTPLGNVESRIKQLEARGEDLSKMPGKSFNELMQTELSPESAKGFANLKREGLVRAAAREIIERDTKAGIYKTVIDPNTGPIDDPIDVLRKYYGEDALEVIDSLIPKLDRAQSYKDILKILDESGYKFKYNPKRPPGSTNVDDAIKTEKDLGIKTLKDDIEDPEGFAAGGRVGMAKGGITALKTLINFLAKNRKNYFLEKNLGKVQGPTTGSKSLQALNPKSLGYKQNFLTKEMDQQYLDNRIDYFKNLQNVIKNDRELLINMKALPKEHQDKFYKMINEGGNKGRLDIYNKIDIDDAIMDIEQIIKNAEFKNLSEEAVKRKLNSEGGSQGLDYLMGIERRGYAGGGGGGGRKKIYDLGKKLLIKKPKKIKVKGEFNKDGTIDYEYYRDEIDDAEHSLSGTETIDELEAMLKERKDEYAYMHQQYKMGKLDPVPGEQTQNRMNFLRKKAEYAGDVKDRRLFTIDELQELNELENMYLKPTQASSFPEEKIYGKYKFTGKESMDDLYQLERQGKITRDDMNVYDPRYMEYLDAQIINKEKLYTRKEWEKTPETIKNKTRGQIDPDWQEANFGEDVHWDQIRGKELEGKTINISDSETANDFANFAKRNDPEGYKKIEDMVNDMNQKRDLENFDVTGRKKNAKGGLNYLMGL